MYELEKEQYLGNTNRSYKGTEGLTVIETEYKSKVFEGWHSHENAHITLFLRGGTFEKRKNVTHLVSPGTILFYHSDELHLNYDTLFPSVNINLEIDPGIFKEFDFTEAQFETASQDNAKTKFLILKIYKECLIHDTFSGDNITMLFSQLSRARYQQKQFLNYPPWVQRLHELLNDCWNENPCLKDLSSMLGVNHITISKHFTRYFGCTLGEYMRRLKTDKAIPLIHKGLSLAEVAYQCGFADQSHFIRTFKDQTGFLPGKFQKI